MKKITLLMPMLFFVFLAFFQFEKASAQITLTVTITDATNCTPPCNGVAAANNVSGATYAWNTTPVQTTPTATGLCPGTYSVTATFMTFTGSGSGTVACVSAVHEYGLDKYVDVFPNPASENLSVNFSYPNGGTVQGFSVFNSIGEKVLSETFSASAKKFSGKLYVGNLPSGVYFLELKDEKNAYRTKFLKE